jgi:hypothetical protein
MSVNPLNINSSAVDASHVVRPPDEHMQDNAGPKDTDTVELSSASVRLSGQAVGADAPPSGTLSTERMQSILDRLSNHHYDQPAVHAAIASGVARDMGSHAT